MKKGRKTEQKLRNEKLEKIITPQNQKKAKKAKRKLEKIITPQHQKTTKKQKRKQTPVQLMEYNRTKTGTKKHSTRNKKDKLNWKALRQEACEGRRGGKKTQGYEQWIKHTLTLYITTPTSTRQFVFMPAGPITQEILTAPTNAIFFVIANLFDRNF